MKIIQICDLHLPPSPTILRGRYPDYQLKKAIAKINQDHSDAQFCVICGDLADTGAIEAYQRLQEQCKTLKIPAHLMIGNHDQRHNFLTVFPHHPIDENGFVQYVTPGPAGQNHAFIMLDTTRDKLARGEFCPQRADWLTARLRQYQGWNVHLFMHHPPFPIGIAGMDVLRIGENTHFLRAISCADPPIRHIFFGHVHRPIGGHWRNIAISTFPSLNHQIALDLHKPGPNERKTTPFCLEPPMIGVILLGEEQTIVHYDYFT